jgi:hypothetical protein
MLGMDPADDSPFPVVLDFTSRGIADYRVRVRHGHEYDRHNFAHSTKDKAALDRRWQDYLAPVFGDYVTIDVATRLALAFRARHAVEMRLAGTTAEIQKARRLRQLYRDLTEFDDVRPASLLIDYLVRHMDALSASTFRHLKPVLRDVVESARDSQAFNRLAKGHVPALLKKLLPGLVKNLTPRAIEDVIRLATGGRSEGHKSPAPTAQQEFARQPRGPFDLVVAGHTHYAEQTSLPPGNENHPRFFLNSGTWRTMIPYGVDGFGRLRAYTIVFCYNEAERNNADADGRRFETWTGHLSAGNIGPYDERVSSPTPEGPPRQVRFQGLQVDSIKGDRVGRAELRVQFGVDDQPLKLSQDGVRNGDLIPIDKPPVTVDPALDGDVWFHGYEKDLGETGLNPHDLLPWGLDRLPRGDDGNVLAGDYALRIEGLNRSKLELRYRVEPVA